MRVAYLFIVVVACLVVCEAATAGKLLPYPLATSGNQIVDSSGNPVRLACVGWDYVEMEQAPFGLYSFNYKTMLQTVVNNGLNCIRMTTYDMGIVNNAPITQMSQSLNPDIYGLGYRDLLVALVNYGGSIGLKFVIDSHTNEGGQTQQDDWGAQQPNGLWYDLGGASDGTDGGGYTGHVSDATFLSIWQQRANLFVGNSYVIGYDLRNEPLAYSGMCTWGTGSNTDIRAMYERVGNAILAIDPNKLIICEGPQNYGGMFQGSLVAPFGDLSAAKTYPVTLNVANRVVYSVHVYPDAVSSFTPDSGSAVIPYYNAGFGYLVTQNIAPLFIGEMGDDMKTADDQAYMNTMISYMNGGQGANGGPTFSGNQQGISWSWWDLEALGDSTSGSAGFGILNSAGTGMDPQQQSYWSQILPLVTSGPTNPPATSKPTAKPTAAPTASPSGTVVYSCCQVIVDSYGNQWEITAARNITRNGVLSQYTANVVEIAYVSGKFWQENSAKLWYYWDQPSSSWLPSTGTTVGPFPTAAPTLKPTTAPTLKPTAKPTAAPTASPSGSVVLPGSGGRIVDAQGKSWTITSGAQIAVNGVTDTSTSNVIELAYVSGDIWQQNTANSWYYKTSAAASWEPEYGTYTPPTTSYSGQVIKFGSSGELKDSLGNYWAITAAANITENGSVSQYTARVTQIAYVNGKVWQENQSGTWWYWSNGWYPTAGTTTSPL